MILIDTNILVYAINVDAPQHTPSRNLIKAVAAGNIPGVLFPQILLEFFAVVTDHRHTKNPLDPETAWKQVTALRTIFPVLEGGAKALDILAEIGQQVKGGEVFDTFLVAQMKANGVSVLCTYNTRDFVNYEGILAHTPDVILARKG